MYPPTEKGGGDYCTWKNYRKETVIEMNFDSLWATTVYQAEMQAWAITEKQENRVSRPGNNSIWLAHRLWICKQGEIKLEKKGYNHVLSGKENFNLNPKLSENLSRFDSVWWHLNIHILTLFNHHSVSPQYSDHHVSLWPGLSTSSSHNCHFPLPKTQFCSFSSPDHRISSIRYQILFTETYNTTQYLKENN